ncbi:MAG: type II secretion system major pseudopilin GspG [Planctomycetota bacterium]
MRTEHRTDRPSQRGFTLVEIMVVIVIIGLLASIVGTNVSGARDVAEIKKAGADIKQIESAVELYMMTNRTRKVPTMEELQTRDRTGHAWLSTDPVDPWGNDYIIREGDRPGGFVVISYGPDGQEGTEDDITSENLRKSKE